MWRIDTNLEPSAPSWRARIGTPPGTWTPTAPTTGGLVALTSVGQAPVEVVLTRVTDAGLTPIWRMALPSGEMWTGAKARCVSPDGTVAVVDAGLTLYALDSRQIITRIAGQSDNLGTCTWLDAETLLWDQEDRHLTMWKRGDVSPQDTGVKGIDPSAGGGRLAWFDDSAGELRVAGIASSAGVVRLVDETGRFYGTAGDRPGAFTLSPDGRWLVGFALVAADSLSVIEVTDVGLVGARSIPSAAIPLGQGDSVTWMPTAP